MRENDDISVGEGAERGEIDIENTEIGLARHLC